MTTETDATRLSLDCTTGSGDHLETTLTLAKNAASKKDFVRLVSWEGGRSAATCLSPQDALKLAAHLVKLAAKPTPASPLARIGAGGLTLGKRGSTAVFDGVAIPTHLLHAAANGGEAGSATGRTVKVGEGQSAILLNTGRYLQASHQLWRDAVDYLEAQDHTERDDVVEAIQGLVPRAE